MYQKPVRNFRTLEVFLSVALAARKGLNLPQDDNINKQKINFVEVYTDEYITKTPLGADCISAAEAKGLYLTLVDSQTNRVENVPFWDFQPSKNGGLRVYFEELTLNLQQSKVYSSTGVANNKSILLSFGYE